MLGLKDYIYEMSIFQDKYPVGTIFKISPASQGASFKKINKALEEYGITIDGNTTFIKQSEDDYNNVDDKGVMVLSKNPTEIFYAKIEGNNKIFKIETTSSSGTLFTKHSDGVAWGENSLEVAQCLGLFFDANEGLTNLLNGDEDHSKYVKIIREVLNSTDNLNSQGQAELNRMLDKKDLSLGDLIMTYTLAAGMSDFSKKVLGSKFKHVVHADIEGIYKAEKENPTLIIKGSKNPTPDIVASTHPAGELISSLTSNEVTYDKKGICKTSDGIEFVLISLKKEDGGAQLGKIYNVVKDKYGLGSFVDIFQSAILSEGWLSTTLNKAKEVVIRVTDTVKNFIKKISAKFIRFESATKTIFLRQLNDNKQDLFKRLLKDMGKPINEDVEFITEDTINTMLIGASDKELNTIVNNINKGLKKLAKIANSYKQILFNGQIKLKLEKNLNQDERYKLFANYVAVTVLSEQLLPASKNTIKELQADMISLLKEMYFGFTELPVYKVYGKGKGHSYEFIGSPKSFTEKIHNHIENANVPIFGIYISYKGGPYYTIYSYFCLGADEEGQIIYSNNRLGTNRSGSFSFNYEGSSTIEYDKLMDKFK